jgi:predicted metalloendopeptidase
VLVALSVAACPASTPVPHSRAGYGFDLADIDARQNPCVDFYQYATGGWAARTPIPPEYPEYGTITILVERNRDTIRRIIEDAAATKHPTATEQQIGDFYAACMDENGINRAGIEPIHVELKSIDSIAEFSGLANEIARLQFEGVNAPFRVGSVADPENSMRMIVQIEQGGLGLPQPEYYVSHDDASKRIQDDYLRHVARTFQLAGEDAEKAEHRAVAVVRLETRLAASSMSRAESRDPNAVSHRMTLERLRALAPKFDWESYFAAMGVRDPGTVNVAQPAFIAAFGRELESTPLTEWKTYLQWHLLERASPALSTPFVAEDFDFYARRLKGVNQEEARWKRCVRDTNSVLSDAVGQLYVRRNYSSDARSRSKEMVKEIVEAFRARLRNVDWMDPSTKSAALQKLAAMKLKVGYPQEWRDYSALTVSRESHVRNQFRASGFELRRALGKAGKPTDRSEWTRPAQTPNASYHAVANEITIPAAVFQPPLYDPQADDAFNYGGIGVLIAHEITHGFDDRGAKYDADGDLRNWWSKPAAENVGSRVACVIDQFDRYVVEGGIHQHGKLLVGEGIADLGGATIAYDAYTKAAHKRTTDALPDHLTPEQRFFLAYARMWSVKIRPEYARARAVSDFHPIGSSRVNVPLSNLPSFGAAFGCKPGEPMMRRPEDTCAIW